MRAVLAAGVCALGAACAAPAHDVTRWPSCETFGETLGPLVAELEPPVTTLRHDDPRAAAIGGVVQSDDGVFDPDAVVDVFAPRVVAGDIRVAVDQMPFTSASQSGHRLTVDKAVAAAVDVHRALRAHTHE